MTKYSVEMDTIEFVSLCMTIGTMKYGLYKIYDWLCDNVGQYNTNWFVNYETYSVLFFEEDKAMAFKITFCFRNKINIIGF